MKSAAVHTESTAERWEAVAEVVDPDAEKVQYQLEPLLYIGNCKLPMLETEDVGQRLNSSL